MTKLTIGDDMAKQLCIAIISVIFVTCVSCARHDDSAAERERAREAAREAQDEARKAADEAREATREAATDARQAQQEARSEMRDAQRELRDSQRELDRELRSNVGDHAGHPGQGEPVNINSADATTLERETGLPRDTVNKLIAARPYTSKRDLVSRKILDEETYRKIEKQVTVQGR